MEAGDIRVRVVEGDDNIWDRGEVVETTMVTVVVTSGVLDHRCGEKVNIRIDRVMVHTKMVQVMVGGARTMMVEIKRIRVFRH